jgi:hypothetical protein
MTKMILTKKTDLHFWGWISLTSMRCGGTHQEQIVHIQVSRIKWFGPHSETGSVIQFEADEDWIHAKEDAATVALLIAKTPSRRPQF